MPEHSDSVLQKNPIEKPPTMRTYNDSMTKPKWIGWLRIIALVVIALLYGGTALLTLSDPPDTLRFVNVDFYTYYAGGKLFWQGNNIYSGDLTGRLLAAEGLYYDKGSNYIYPPYVAAFLAPFTQVLSGKALGFLWFFIMLTALLGAVWMAVLIFFPDEPPNRQRLQWLDWSILALLYVPTNYSYFVGQINPLLLILLTGFLFCLQHGRDRLAGLLLAAAILIKVAPAIFLLYLIIRRRWTALVMALSLSIVGLGISLAPLWGQWMNYFQIALPDSTRLVSHPANQSISAFFSRLLVASPFTNPLIVSSSLARVAATGAALLLLAISSIATYRTSRDNRAGILSFCLFLVTMVLISPLAWENLFVLIVFPLLAIFYLWPKLSSIEKGLVVFAIILSIVQRLWAPHGVAPDETPGLNNWTLLMSLLLYSTLILYTILRRHVIPKIRREAEL